MFNHMFCSVLRTSKCWIFTKYLPTALFQAYLVLKEREAAGVEPLSRDLADPAKLMAHLPSDEELKAAGVVINI